MGVTPFEQVVTDHGGRVLRVCRAVLGPVDADDAWSETFLAALRAYPTLPPEANVEAWLVTIAHRKSIDLHRRRRRDPVPVAGLVGGRVARPGGSGDDDGEPDHADLYDALRSLPDKQRWCVAYHHLGGLPYREVGALVGTSESAARRASADGMRALRAALATEGRTDHDLHNTGARHE